MTIRVFILAVVFILIVVFAAVNWSVFTTPTTLSLVVTSIHAPLGLVMLGLLVLLTVLFLAFIVFMQTSVILEARRRARELQTQRELADKAEASRYTDLKALLESKFSQIQEEAGRSGSALMGRLDRLDGELRNTVEQAGNTLAAYIGELEDRLEGRAGGEDRSRPA